MTHQEMINKCLKYLDGTAERADLESYTDAVIKLKNFIFLPSGVKKRLTIKDRMMFDAYEIMNGRGMG